MKMTSRSPTSLRRLSVFLLDCAALAVSFYAAFLLRFAFPLDSDVTAIFLQTLPVILPVYILSYYFNRVYRGIYYYSSFEDLQNIARGTALAALVAAAAILFIRQGQFPRSILIFYPVLAFVAIGGIRFSIRQGKTWLNMPRAYTGKERSVLLVGAGELGESLLRQMQKTLEPRYRVVGFLDDDASKWGMQIHGCEVFGGRAALPDVLGRYQVDEIVIAISAQRGELVRAMVEALKDLKPKPELKVAPSLSEMLFAPGREVRVRKVRPMDLLSRAVIALDEKRIAALFEGKTVLVTGAGGTIGAELCRQVLHYRAGRLILVEGHATSLFHIESEANEKARGTQIVAILGDVRDKASVDRIFAAHKPDIVLHAAAHKHVHQLEQNVQEGVLNNALATLHLCTAALKHGTQAFLLVSTDKAVKPSSVMGATKRLAEIVVTSFAGRGKTRYAAVRFGNVLGSSGSVLTIFREQIDKGGPLTVTHPDVRRYFMTVEEAVGLILQSVTMSIGGEIFVLKMGQPVRILDMAKNLILLSGVEPDKDIEIKFTGLKQGEKMNEELMEDPAGFDASEHSDILVLRGENRALPDLEKRLLDLEVATRGLDAEGVVRRLCELVPTFRPDAAHTPTPAPREL